MTKWRWDQHVDDDFEIDEEYVGFQKIKRGNKKPLDEVKGAKKKNSPKHTPRPDKE